MSNDASHLVADVDTLEVNALRLMRATGIRISEGIPLSASCQNPTNSCAGRKQGRRPSGPES
jgi:hypothetical protein